MCIRDRIKRRLKERRPCKVIATSLVEAGVDFDFQTVYRELAGIDSVIQAAGRCNWEGKLDRKECETVVFTLEKDDTIRLPQSLKLPENVAAQIKDEYEDIASLDAISAYFSRLYRFRGEQGLDTKNILKQLSERLSLIHILTFLKQIQENSYYSQMAVSARCV